MRFLPDISDPGYGGAAAVYNYIHSYNGQRAGDVGARRGGRERRV